MKIPLSVIFLLLIGVPSNAQRVSTRTGNDLLEFCESKKEFEQAFCLGYITGVTDMEGMNTAAFPDRQRSCISTIVTNGQLIDVVLKYLKDHPEERHMLAAVLIVKSMAQAFPCKTH
jgi:hypothetical protein